MIALKSALSFFIMLVSLTSGCLLQSMESTLTPQELLWLGIEKNDEKLVEQAINREADVKLPEKGITPFGQAILNGYLPIINLLGEKIHELLIIDNKEARPEIMLRPNFQAHASFNQAEPCPHSSQTGLHFIPYTITPRGLNNFAEAEDENEHDHVTVDVDVIRDSIS